MAGVVPPSRVYPERLAARRAHAELLRRKTSGLSLARLLVFAAAPGVLIGALVTQLWVAAWFALLPLVAFAVLVVLHQRSRQAFERAERAVDFYALGLERLRCTPPEQGWIAADFAPRDHPYAEHLDLFGPGSLFALLCQAQTRGGAERLAGWLLEPADRKHILERQQSAADLCERLDLREDRAAAAPRVDGGISAQWLVDWGADPGDAPPASVRVGLALLAAAALATATWGIAFGGGLGPFLAVAAIEAWAAWTQRAHVRGVRDAVERPARALQRLAELLERFEREEFQAPRLVELRARMQRSGRLPSAEIARLHRRVELFDSRRNQLFTLISPFLLWGTQFALAIQAWRAEFGPELAGWFDTLCELEALCDLGGYAYEHLSDPFPEIAGSERGPLIDGRGLGHPLIAQERAVRNDVRLDAECALHVVSGSNMSGKSTWLRTIGTNAVLGLAGAPVRATSLRLSRLRVGASIRVQDSLQEGSSRFYAEIRGLERIVSLASEGPVLFLLDEILAGTNSHDRGIGAEALVRAFLERGAIGLLTTHDLALARIADELGPRAANVHFEDHIEDGVIHFDYRVRPGVVTRSNALALMRAVGLKV